MHGQGQRSGAHPATHPAKHPGGAVGGPRLLEDGSPVCRLIAWEVTRSCNLACKHCRAEAHPEPYPGELSTAEAKALIDTFPQVGNPIIIFTGGDPMMRPDVYELVAYAHGRGLTCAFSPNGTLITPENARLIRKAGCARRVCGQHARHRLPQGRGRALSDQHHGDAQQPWQLQEDF